LNKKLKGLQPIANIKSSHGGELLSTTPFIDRIVQSPIQFGIIVASFVILDDSGLSSSIEQKYIFVSDCSSSMTGDRIHRAK
jgi:hypothetical protein